MNNIYLRHKKNNSIIFYDLNGLSKHVTKLFDKRMTGSLQLYRYFFQVYFYHNHSVLKSEVNYHLSICNTRKGLFEQVNESEYNEAINNIDSNFNSITGQLNSVFEQNIDNVITYSTNQINLLRSKNGVYLHFGEEIESHYKVYFIECNILNTKFEPLTDFFFQVLKSNINYSKRSISLKEFCDKFNNFFDYIIENSKKWQQNPLAYKKTYEEKLKEKELNYPQQTINKIISDKKPTQGRKKINKPDKFTQPINNNPQIQLF